VLSILLCKYHDLSPLPKKDTLIIKHIFLCHTAFIPTDDTTVEQHYTISLITNASKIELRIHRGRAEKKTEDVFGEDRFGFWRGKGTTYANGMLKRMSG
jgi:hypothetical protein